MVTFHPSIPPASPTTALKPRSSRTVDIVVGRDRDHRLELSRQVGLAVDRLAFGLAARDLLTLEPDHPVGARSRQEVVADRARQLERRAVRLAAIARRAGIGRPAVWRWQQRFAEAGVDGPLRDKTRKPGKPPTPDGVVQRMVALTCRRAAGRGDPLDGSDDGQGRRSVLADRAADLGGPPAAAPPRPHLQAQPGSRLLSPSSRTLSGCTWRHRGKRSCCRWTRRARSMAPSASPRRRLSRSANSAAVNGGCLRWWCGRRDLGADLHCRDQSRYRPLDLA